MHNKTTMSNPTYQPVPAKSNYKRAKKNTVAYSGVGSTAILHSTATLAGIPQANPSTSTVATRWHGATKAATRFPSSALFSTKKCGSLQAANRRR